MRLETKRLVLREYTMDDLDSLHQILSDPESMRHYPAPFSYSQSKSWIERNLVRYRRDGFGLWAVILKDNGRFIGDCGITMQTIDGALKPEIGYHIHKAYTNNGYATEAAAACKAFAFDVLKLPGVYSYMKYTNLPSQRVAEKNGMTLVAQLKDEVNTVTHVYGITREQYLALKT